MQVDDPPYQGAPRAHPTGYMRPEVHEAIFLNSPQQRSETPVNSISVPLLMVLIGAVALVGATYTATSHLNEIKVAIQRLGDKLAVDIGNHSDRIGRIETELQNRTADRYTRSEHDLWCSRTEQANIASGWKCASLSGRIEFAPRVNGWTANGTKAGRK